MASRNTIQWKLVSAKKKGAKPRGKTMRCSRRECVVFPGKEKGGESGVYTPEWGRAGR